MLLKLAPQAYNRYFEPFAGSAIFFLSNPQKLALLSDINPRLVETWQYIRSSPDKIAHELSSLATDAQTYYAVRAIDPRDQTPLERSVSFLYLNRLCFNGVYRTNKNGRFNVPIGSRWGHMPTLEELQYTANHLQRCHLVCHDFERIVGMAKEGDFVYLDPPYYSSNRKTDGEFGYGAFKPADEARLCSALNHLHERGAFFMLSYNKSPHVMKRLEWCNQVELNPMRNVGGASATRRRNMEQVYRNYTLTNAWPNKL